MKFMYSIENMVLKDCLIKHPALLQYLKSDPCTLRELTMKKCYLSGKDMQALAVSLAGSQTIFTLEYFLAVLSLVSYLCADCLSFIMLPKGSKNWLKC